MPAVRACRHTAAAGMRRRPGSRLPSVGCGSQPNTPQCTAKARRQPVLVFKKIAAAAHQKIDAVEESSTAGELSSTAGSFFPTAARAAGLAIGERGCYVKKWTYDVIFFTYDVIFFT